MNINGFYLVRFLCICISHCAIAKKFLATTNGRQHVFFGVRNVSNRSAFVDYGTNSFKSIFTRISLEFSLYI